VEAWALKMEPWMVYRPVAGHSHPFDEEQDADVDPDSGSVLMLDQDLGPH
jgi:hypothetical protein